MNFNFSKNIQDFLKIIAKTALSNNLRVFFVGGIVRDNLLNLKIKDIDLILEGNAIEFSKKLPEQIQIKSIHRDFNTVKLCYLDLNIDLASTRTEEYNYSGSLPTVKNVGVKIEEDVKRRDFTVNSLYCEILIKDGKLEYSLIDLVDGKEDIKNKTLKSLHKNTYIDDPTRIFRGLGFKYRFGFDFSEYDKKLINEYLDNINLQNASISRILEVLKKVLNNEFQDDIFKETVNKKYYKILNVNELSVDFNSVKFTINEFSLNIEQKAQFYFDILTSKEETIPEFKDKIQEYNFYYKQDIAQKAYLYYKTGNNNIIKFSKIKIFTKGKDLINLNYPKGKIIGKILDNILLKKLENPNMFNTLEDELNWVKMNYPIETIL